MSHERGDDDFGYTMTPKDSGARRQFETGAVRDRAAGKGRFDLLFWAFVWRCARWMEAGARKYSDRNWEKGIPSSAFLDSAFRHLAKYAMGYRDEDHLAAAYFNIQGLAYNEYMVQRGARPDVLLDLPSYVAEGEEP